jgi:hypothetical protein
VLCLCDETSGLLLANNAWALRSRGPQAVMVTVPGGGHAPAPNTSEQWSLVGRGLGCPIE